MQCGSRRRANFLSRLPCSSRWAARFPGGRSTDRAIQLIHCDGRDRSAIHGSGDLVVFAVGGTAGRFDHYKALSPAGCNVATWDCIRGTSYLYPASQLTNAQAAAYEAARKRLEQAAFDELAVRDKDLLQELLDGFAEEYDAAKRRESALDGAGRKRNASGTKAGDEETDPPQCSCAHGCSQQRGADGKVDGLA